MEGKGYWSHPPRSNRRPADYEEYSLAPNARLALYGSACYQPLGEPAFAQMATSNYLKQVGFWHSFRTGIGSPRGHGLLPSSHGYTFGWVYLLCRFPNGATVWLYVFPLWSSKLSISKRETKSRSPSRENVISRWPVTGPKRGHSATPSNEVVLPSGFQIQSRRDQ